MMGGMIDRTECDRWLRVMARLRVDRARGIAPHKPLLLLVLAEMAEEGNLPEPIIPLTADLVFRFLSFGSIAAERRRQRPDIRLPFYYLHSDGCLTPLDADGKATSERNRQVAARLDQGLFTCLQDTVFRSKARRILIATYFTDPGERAALYALVGIPVPSDDVVKSDARFYREDKDRGREARFRLTVVPAYDYTCALTGYRLTTIDSGSIVDAAHIHQFADSRNNDPRNGIALSKNAHWLFDQGLWSLSDDYRVIVASQRFDESGDDAFLLRNMGGKQIALPINRDYWPDKAHLNWHREHKFGSV
jgi:putative restriction endonuclease